MSDSAITPVRPQRTNVRTDCSWYPRFFITAAEMHQGATTLVKHGKADFRQFMERTIRLPADEAALKELDDLITGDFELWLALNEDMPDEPDETEGQEEVLDRWAREGSRPPLREALIELSMPGLTSECAEYAAEHFRDWAERSAEREELASFRVERWVKGTSPFKGHDWLPRAELWTGYEVWCRFDGGGHDPGKPNDFYTALQELGFAPAGRQGKRGFKPPKH